MTKPSKVQATSDADAIVRATVKSGNTNSESTIPPATLPPTPKVDVAVQYDPALMTAWQRFLDYDRISSKQKQSYLKLRKWVIYISFATTVLAVLSTFFLQWVDTWGLTTELRNFVDIALRILLVGLPVLSVALMSYSSQFASSTAWIEYRVAAELIRQNIYRFRLGAGKFANLSLREAQETLISAIAEADDRIDKANATLPYMQVASHEEILKTIAEKAGYDNPDSGLTTLREGTFNVNSYLNWRILPQIDWYINRIDRDYRDLQAYRKWALIVSGFGAVLSAFGGNLIAGVAITTALGSAINLYGGTRMFGGTYAIYHTTATKLRRELLRWEILTDAERQDPGNQSKVVDMMEEIFADEGELWRSTAIQQQASNEQAVYNALQQGTTELQAQAAIEEEGKAADSGTIVLTPDADGN